RLEGEVEVVLTDAADERHQRVAERGLSLLKVGVRDGIADLRGVGEGACLNLLRRERSDRDRRLLQVLLAKARRDDDFLEAHALLLREGREGSGECDGAERARDRLLSRSLLHVTL